MNKTNSIYKTKVMANGQITIPKDILTILGVSTNDYVNIIIKENTVRIISSKLHVFHTFQEQMKNEAAKAELSSEEDVATWITQSRRKENTK